MVAQEGELDWGSDSKIEATANAASNTGTDMVNNRCTIAVIFKMVEQWCSQSRQAIE